MKKDSEKTIKYWEELKKKGLKTYIISNAIFFGPFVWGITLLLKKTKQNTFSEIFFSKASFTEFFIYLASAFLLYFSLWHFHKYQYKKAISKQKKEQNE